MELERSELLERTIEAVRGGRLPRWAELPDLGLYMDQVIVLMGQYLGGIVSGEDKLLTASMVNNYVKMGLLPPPAKKKYGREHLAYLIMICVLKRVISISIVRELIRVNEALHEKRFAEIAGEIVRRNVRAILIAGPSSSGKTTSANRLCTQLRVLGKTPLLFSLDDYYKDRSLVAPEPDGTFDYEHIKMIDVERFNEDLSALLRGEAVEPPTLDFSTGRSLPGGRTILLDENTPLVIEGLHALNPQLLTEEIHREDVFKLYVSALTTLNLDDHNRIPTSDVRLLRRLVRDYLTRGATVERTLGMWDSVQRGEHRWIFPYQEGADAIFNTALVYELSVLKKHIFPLLQSVEPDSPCYDQVRNIIKFLNYVQDASVEDEIPPTSILREFVGGNTFYLRG